MSAHEVERGHYTNGIRSHATDMISTRQDAAHGANKRESTVSEKTFESVNGGDERDIKKRQDFKGKYLLW